MRITEAEIEDEVFESNLDDLGEADGSPARNLSLLCARANGLTGDWGAAETQAPTKPSLTLLCRGEREKQTSSAREAVQSPAWRIDSSNLTAACAKANGLPGAFGPLPTAARKLNMTELCAAAYAKRTTSPRSNPVPALDVKLKGTLTQACVDAKNSAATKRESTGLFSDAFIDTLCAISKAILIPSEAAESRREVPIPFTAEELEAYSLNAHAAMAAQEKGRHPIVSSN